MSADPHVLYRDARARLVSQLGSLSDAESQVPVPTCPGWSVKDVAAHLSGLVAETLAGVPPPRGSDEATSRQVRDRETMTLAEVCDEWTNNAAAFGELAATDPDYTRALLADLVVHTHDIAEALDLPINASAPEVLMVATRYGTLLQQRAAEQLDVALTLDFKDAGQLEPTAGSKPLQLTASPLTFLRGVTGRRSRETVEALEWAGDPAELLSTCFNQYG